MSMYERFADDISIDLFNSVYDDLYAMASRDNAARYAACKRKRDYRPGEAQDMFNAFAAGARRLAKRLILSKLTSARSSCYWRGA